jgi:hypothetical protein
MSPEASKCLTRWLDWIGHDATDEQLDEALLRWEQGIDPPSTPMPIEWPKDEGNKQ